MQDLMKKGRDIYELVCRTLEAQQIEIEKREEELGAVFGVTSENVSMGMIFFVDTKRQLLRVWAALPFAVRKDRRAELAMAICQVNQGVPHGKFVLELDEEDSVGFKLCESYRGGRLGEDAILLMLACAVAMAELYQDKLKGIAEGTLSVEDI